MLGLGHMLPMMGYLASGVQFETLMLKWRQEYGPFFEFKMPGNPCVVIVADPEAIKEVCTWKSCTFYEVCSVQMTCRDASSGLGDGNDWCGLGHLYLLGPMWAVTACAASTPQRWLARPVSSQLCVTVPLFAGVRDQAVPQVAPLYGPPAHCWTTEYAADRGTRVEEPKRGLQPR